MANKKRSFDDRQIKCKRCFLPVGVAMIDQQCLIIGNLAFFNWARFACLRCEAINNWQAPNLTDEAQTYNQLYPDDLSDLPKGNARFSKTGVLGVSRMGNKFRAVLSVNRKNIYLGLFNSLKEASEAYQTAKQRHSGKVSIPAGLSSENRRLTLSKLFQPRNKKSPSQILISSGSSVSSVRVAVRSVVIRIL